MWEILKDLLLVSLGMGIGIVLMCILSVGKEADRCIEEIKESEDKYHEFRTKLISMVFIKRTELGAYVNRSNWYLLRVQA